jgi:glucans biosynthesis protein
LFQRDRRYEHYMDIELAYEERPSYWIEPKEDWGSGVVELVELATKDETADNIVCAFVPDGPIDPGKPFTFSYRIHSLNDGLNLHNLAFVTNTFNAPAYALGSNEQQAGNARRFMVDFAGGEMDYYLKNPGLVKIVASARNARIFRTFLVPNPKGQGFRAMIDVKFEENQVGTIRAFLSSGQKPLTETWSYSWRIYNF